MRGQSLFIAIFVACSGSPPAQLTPRPPVPAPPPADAPPAPPKLAQRGDACGTCETGLLCAPLPGGYCASSCDQAACNGTCVETGRAGEVCMKSCASDADCRTSEGYVCDAHWKACMIPNFAAIVAATCAALPLDPGWSASEAWTTSSTAGTYQFEPTAVLSDDGSVTAIAISRAAITEGNALVVMRGPGSGAPLSSTKRSHFDPWLARDRKGTLYATWLGFNGRDEDQEIALSTSSDQGATWSTPVAVHNPADCNAGPDECLDKPMVVASADTLYIMYSAGEAGLRVRTSKDGGKTFGTPVTALEGIYGNAVAGSDGRVHVVTNNGGPLGAYGSAEQWIEYTVTADDGNTFAKPITVSAPQEVIPFFFSNPSVAVDDRRKWLYVAYARGGRDAKWDIVIAASRDAGKTWTRTTLGDPCTLDMVPNLAVDPVTGLVHLAWYASAGDGAFAHAVCNIGAAKCSAPTRINSEPFAALSTERHGAKWVGEYESLLVDDKRRVLHAIWAQPVATGDKPAARIFHATLKLKP